MLNYPNYSTEQINTFNTINRRKELFCTIQVSILNSTKIIPCRAEMKSSLQTSLTESLEVKLGSLENRLFFTSKIIFFSSSKI